MVDYARSLALAQRLINANGRTITLRQLSGTAADSDKPWEGPSDTTVTTAVTAKAVFVPHNGQEDLGKFGVDDELFKRFEQVALVASDGTNDFNDFQQVVDGGRTWTIGLIRELRPGDTSIMYVLGLNR